SEGFVESSIDAVGNWDMDLQKTFEQLSVVLYSGTGMLNTLLSRTGRRIGLIVTRGMEDAILMGLGLQTWTDYSYPDRLHAVTHQAKDPRRPRDRVYGVTGRIEQFGNVVILFYPDEAEQDANALLKQGVEGICIVCINSFCDDAHERGIADLVQNVL